MIWVDLIWFAFAFIEGNYASYDSFMKIQHHFMHINFRYFLLIVYKLVLLMLKVKQFKWLHYAQYLKLYLKIFWNTILAIYQIHDVN